MKATAINSASSDTEQPSLDERPSAGFATKHFYDPPQQKQSILSAGSQQRFSMKESNSTPKDPSSQSSLIGPGSKIVPNSVGGQLAAHSSNLPPKYIALQYPLGAPQQQVAPKKKKLLQQQSAQAALMQLKAASMHAQQANLPPMAQNFISGSSPSRNAEVKKTLSAQGAPTGTLEEPPLAKPAEGENLPSSTNSSGGVVQLKQITRGLNKPISQSVNSRTSTGSNSGSSRFARSNFGQQSVNNEEQKEAIQNILVRKSRNGETAQGYKSMGAPSSASALAQAPSGPPPLNAPYLALKQAKNLPTRNIPLSATASAKTTWKAPAVDANGTPNPHFAYGTGRFLQGLRGELAQLDHEDLMLASYEPAKYSGKRNGIIAAYGANTNQGIIRNYNEDRVAIILNIMKPKSKEGKVEYWPKCSFFGIYDGHGGNQCAEFLRDYLHQFIIKDENFPQYPIKAIRNGFREAEKLFLEFAEKQVEDVGEIDRSGSCAIVIIIIDDTCYVANVGDSRAIMSAELGEKIYVLSNDHKPTDDVEMKRIVENGGRIYQNSSVIPHPNPTFKGQQQVIYGPHRVFPGRLSVSRTFGDIEAKLPKLEGNPNVVVAEPDITAFKITESMKLDYILIGCDGIFDKMDNKETLHLVWQSILERQKELQSGARHHLGEDSIDVHQACGLAVDSILKTSALRKACDNLTVVLIAFDHFESYINRRVPPQQYPVKEEKIVEALLPPLLEVNDTTGGLNDIKELMRRASVLAANERSRPNVLFLDNDDAIDDITLESPPSQPAFLGEEQNLDDIVIAGGQQDLYKPFQQRQFMTQTLKAPLQKNNLLSEISEEDDVVSMISERHGSTGEDRRNSKASSKGNSSKFSQNKIPMQNFQPQPPNQPYLLAQSSEQLAVKSASNGGVEGTLVSQPANLQDNHPENATIAEIEHFRKQRNSSSSLKSRMKDHIQISRQPMQNFIAPGVDPATVMLYHEPQQVRIKKVLTPGNGSAQLKKRQSRNDPLTRNALNSKTQQPEDLRQGIQQQQPMPLVRPQSGSMRRQSAQSNGQFNTIQPGPLPQRTIPLNFNSTMQITSSQLRGIANRTEQGQPQVLPISSLTAHQQLIKPIISFSKTQKSETIKRTIQSLNASSQPPKMLSGNNKITLPQPQASGAPPLVIGQAQQVYLQKLGGVGPLTKGSLLKTQPIQKWSSINRQSNNATPIINTDFSTS